MVLGAARLIFMFALLIVRGLLLWIVVPATFVVWLVIGPFLRPRVNYAKTLAWVDWNFTVLHARTWYRVRFDEFRMNRWWPWRDVGSIEHRVGIFDGDLWRSTKGPPGPR